jgi:phosphoglycolate phosphatase-like HAD superfamily hydrolase
LEIAKLADTNGWELSTTVGATTYFRQRPGQALGAFAPGRAIVAVNSALCNSRLSGKCRIHQYTSPDSKSLGIYGLRANKGNALSLVMQRLGVSQSDVMAIGDDLNDLPMFAHARIKIAMGNANPEVRAQATVIAPTNDDEGVAWALRHFGFSS